MNLKNWAVSTPARAVAAVIIVLCLAGVAAAQEASATAGAAATTAGDSFTDPAPPAPAADPYAVAYFSTANSSAIGNQVEAPDGWRFLVAIPLWLPGLNGDVTAKGFTFTADQDTSDVLDLVGSHLNGAVALHLEAQKDRFGLFTEFMYVSMAAEATPAWARRSARISTRSSARSAPSTRCTPPTTSGG
jgi:hypothetical protein